MSLKYEPASELLHIYVQYLGWWKHRVEIGRDRLHRLYPHGSSIKSSFSITLIRVTSRRIPASSSTNQGPENGDLVKHRVEVGAEAGRDRLHLPQGLGFRVQGLGLRI